MWLKEFINNLITADFNLENSGISGLTKEPKSGN